MTPSVPKAVLMARHGGDKYISRTNSRNLSLLPEGRDQLQKSANPSSSCESDPLPSANGLSSPRPNWRVLLPRGVIVVCDLLVLGDHLRNERRMLPAIS